MPNTTGSSPPAPPPPDRKSSGAWALPGVRNPRNGPRGILGAGTLFARPGPVLGGAGGYGAPNVRWGGALPGCATSDPPPCSPGLHGSYLHGGSDFSGGGAGGLAQQTSAGRQGSHASVSLHSASSCSLLRVSQVFREMCSRTQIVVSILRLSAASSSFPAT